MKRGSERVQQGALPVPAGALLWLALLAAALACPAGAQVPQPASPAPLDLRTAGVFAGYAEEQQDLDGRRQRALATLDAESAACYERFAVNDCLAKVQVRRRAALAELTRQQNVLDDAQRKERSQQAWQAQQRKRATLAATGAGAGDALPLADASADTASDGAQVPGADPFLPAAAKPTRAASSANAGTVGPAHAASGLSAAEMARNRAAYAQRLADQAAHRAAVQQRLASQPERPALPTPTDLAP